MKKTDAPAVASIQVRAWRKAYATIIDSAYLSSLNVEKKIIDWQTGMEVNDDVTRLLVCKNQKVLGFAVGLENRDSIEDADAELAAIYIDPDHWNKRLGGKLFLKMEDEFRIKGFRSYFVWVLEENFLARRFYEKRGGKILPQRKAITLNRISYPVVSYLFKL